MLPDLPHVLRGTAYVARACWVYAWLVEISGEHAWANSACHDTACCCWNGHWQLGVIVLLLVVVAVLLLLVVAAVLLLLLVVVTVLLLLLLLLLVLVIGVNSATASATTVCGICICELVPRAELLV